MRPHGAPYVTALVLLGGWALAWAAQEARVPADRMLLSAIQGRRYERVSYDAKGGIDERAVVAVGQLQRAGNELIVPLQVEVFKNGAVERRFSARWTCAPDAGDMVMAVLVFRGDLDQPSMRLETKGAPLVYPYDVPLDGVLGDVSVEVKVRQGFLRFMRGRTQIRMTDRRIAPGRQATASSRPVAARAYIITSHVELSAYAWGIRVRRTHYESEETVEPDEGLLSHVLRRADGGYSEFRRLDDRPTEKGETR